MATNNKKLTIKINLIFKLMLNILLKSKKKTLNKVFFYTFHSKII